MIRYIYESLVVHGFYKSTCSREATLFVSWFDWNLNQGWTSTNTSYFDVHAWLVTRSHLPLHFRCLLSENKMGVSTNGGTQKWMVWEYPYFRTPPNSTPKIRAPSSWLGGVSQNDSMDFLSIFRPSCRWDIPTNLHLHLHIYIMYVCIYIYIFMGYFPLALPTC